jgi:hypothetical protein
MESTGKRMLRYTSGKGSRRAMPIEEYEEYFVTAVLMVIMLAVVQW